MTDPEFEVAGVGIRRMLRSLTRAGTVRVHDGRLVLATSYGSEIDSAPLERAHLTAYGLPRTTLAKLGETRYLLDLPLAQQSGLLSAVRTARAKQAAEQGVLGA